MYEVGAFEAKNTLGSLLDRVERGEEVLITRHGKPVARLTTFEADTGSQTRAKEAFDRIRERAADLKPGRFDRPAVKQDRDAGQIAMNGTVCLDDDLLQRAQEYSGVSEPTVLLREGLKALIEREASRSLAVLEGTMPDLDNVRRLRVDDL